MTGGCGVVMLMDSRCHSSLLVSNAVCSELHFASLAYYTFLKTYCLGFIFKLNGSLNKGIQFFFLTKKFYLSQ